MVDGVESYQVKKVVYKMDDKTEVKSQLMMIYLLNIIII